MNQFSVIKSDKISPVKNSVACVINTKTTEISNFSGKLSAKNIVSYNIMSPMQEYIALITAFNLVPLVSVCK